MSFSSLQQSDSPLPLSSFLLHLPATIVTHLCHCHLPFLPQCDSPLPVSLSLVLSSGSELRELSATGSTLDTLSPASFSPFCSRGARIGGSLKNSTGSVCDVGRGSASCTCVFGHCLLGVLFTIEDFFSILCIHSCVF